jgi:hypothetical protein
VGGIRLRDRSDGELEAGGGGDLRVATQGNGLTSESFVDVAAFSTEAGRFEDLPGKWQAAILEAEQNRPKLRVVTND